MAHASPSPDESPRAETSTATRVLKLTVAYDGTRYNGWQLQPDQPTIQGTLERVWQRITRETVRMTGCSRTDSGVHALAQVVSLHTESRLSGETLQRALNAFLPDDIVVTRVDAAPADFHAIRSARQKRYRYTIHDGRWYDPFERLYVWHYRERLDAERMHRAGQALLGTHDFRSFESRWPNRDSSVRTIFDLSVRRRPVPEAEYVDLEVVGDGFLYNMVRAIVGTLVEVGRGARDEAWIAEVLAAQNRSAAGMTAPAQGLYLVEIDYE